MTSHDACTSGTSRVLTVASLQRLKMEAVIPAPSDCGLRSVIEFLNAQSIVPIEIHHQLYQIYGASQVHTICSRWTTCAWWGAKWEVIHHYGRPYGACAGTFMENLSIHNTETLYSFPADFPLLKLSWSTCLENCAPVGWQSNTPEHKAKRMESALTLMQRYHDDGDEFLNRIVTGDETWVAQIIPETKLESMHWRHSESPCKTKFKQTLSAWKVLCTVFWDRRGILLVDFLTRDETVNAER